MPTVAGVIIGNEILTGKFSDENGPFLIRRCRELGADLQRLVVVPDEFSVLVMEISACARTFDRVVTTGGVGPTHDDITMQAVAAAFDVPLVEHPELVELMHSFGMELTPSVRRMAHVPKGVTLHWRPGLRYPVVAKDSVFIFPGVPKYFQSKFDAISDCFEGTPLFTDRIFVRAKESDIAERLSSVNDQWGEVAIGSYPRFTEQPHVIITLESRVKGSLRQAANRVRQVLHDVVFEP